jgi:hypothetical protein
MLFVPVKKTAGVVYKGGRISIACSINFES